MKTQISALSGIFVFLIVFFASCKDTAQQELNPDAVSALEQAVEQANQDYRTSEVSGGDEQTPFSVINEGLIDEYLAREGDLEYSERSAGNRLTGCLRSLNLSDEQISQVRRTLKGLETRNEKIIQRHRDAFAALNAGMEARRNNLNRQLANGQLDREEFRTRMTYLRNQYQKALLRIKESNAGEFSRSHRLLMQHLQKILNERQWNAFTSCLRG